MTDVQKRVLTLHPHTKNISLPCKKSMSWHQHVDVSSNCLEHSLSLLMTQQGMPCLLYLFYIDRQGCFSLACGPLTSCDMLHWRKSYTRESVKFNFTCKVTTVPWTSEGPACFVVHIQNKPRTGHQIWGHCDRAIKLILLLEHLSLPMTAILEIRIADLLRFCICVRCPTSLALHAKQKIDYIQWKQNSLYSFTFHQCCLC